MTVSVAVGRVVLGVVLLVSMLMLGACNTIQGVGRDLSAAGSAMSRTAEDAKRN